MQVTQEVESKRINLETENIIIAASKGWQPGVIGLVASRIVGAYGKPTLLLHLTDKGLAKGSCRSIAGFAEQDLPQNNFSFSEKQEI
mgnify:CR=1 FL=1